MQWGTGSYSDKRYSDSSLILTLTRKQTRPQSARQGYGGLAEIPCQTKLLYALGTFFYSNRLVLPS